jgi:hypothetical protein
MKIRRLIALIGLRRSSGRRTLAAVTLAAALASAQTPALAGAKVGGNPEAVTLDAQNIPIVEILAALGHDFNVHYHSSVDLNRQISGTYEGSVRQVVSRILEGYNFVVKSGPGGIEVTVFGTPDGPMTNAMPRAAFGGPIRQPPPGFPAAPARPNLGAPPARPSKMQLSDVAPPVPPFPASAAANAPSPPSPAETRHLFIRRNAEDDGVGHP